MPTVIREFGRARAGEISALSVGAFHSGELLTAVRNGSDNLELILWYPEPADGTIARGQDSGTQAGEVGEVALCMLGGQRCLTAVQNANGHLLVIPWALESDGTLSRLEYADAQGGNDTNIVVTS